MTAPPLAAFSLSESQTTNILYVIVGVLVLLVFVIGSRVIARFAAEQLRARQVRSEVVVIVRRVVYVVVLAIGIFAAIGFALQNQNIGLLGILLATLVAALGVQDLLKDYVSGYYVLLERHIRVGDHIGVEEFSGIVTEVRLRVTLLTSDSGDLVVIPNSELFGKPVTIRSRANGVKPEPPA
jgi:small-conductance mechanosensitive channel